MEGQHHFSNNDTFQSAVFEQPGNTSWTCEWNVEAFHKYVKSKVKTRYAILKTHYAPLNPMRWLLFVESQLKCGILLGNPQVFVFEATAYCPNSLYVAISTCISVGVSADSVFKAIHKLSSKTSHHCFLNAPRKRSRGRFVYISSIPCPLLLFGSAYSSHFCWSYTRCFNKNPSPD